MENKVTDIQIVPLKPKDGLVAFASFVFDGLFYFGSIGIFTRAQGGYRLTYPTRKVSSASINIYHPINKEVSQAIEEAVIGKYEELIS